MSTISLLALAISSFGATPNAVVLDFSATWCGPCQQMSPVVARLQREGYKIQTVDVDERPDLARRFNIQSIPAFVRVVGEQEVSRSIGLISESELRHLARPEHQTVSAPDRPVVLASQDALANMTSPSRRSTPTHPLPPTQSSSEAGDRLTKAESPSKLPFDFPFLRKKKTPVKPAILQETSVVRAKHDGLDVNGVYKATSPSVRIRVQGSGTVNFGSGTIVDSRVGRTLVVTCGHVLRDLQASDRIEVDVFCGDRFETFVGRAVRSNQTADVGVIAIPTAERFPTAIVADSDAAADRGDYVFSVGCGGGGNPTREEHRVTALNRYLGPDNIECTGTPMQGRSGGGLFNQHGQLIGVCIAADPDEKRGLYAGLEPVHEILAQCDFSNTGESFPERGMPSAPEPAGEPVSEPSAILAEQDQMDPVTDGTSTQGTRQIMDDVRDTLADVEEAEVVCIIRPLNQPQSASRVVIINRASKRFVADLTGELASQPRLTSESVSLDEATKRTEQVRLQRYSR